MNPFKFGLWKEGSQVSLAFPMKLTFSIKLKTEEGQKILKFKIPFGDINPNNSPETLIYSDPKENVYSCIAQKYETCLEENDTVFKHKHILLKYSVLRPLNLAEVISIRPHNRCQGYMIILEIN